jgi:hypothetical protein
MGASSTGAMADPAPTLDRTRLFARACISGEVVRAMVLAEVGYVGAANAPNAPRISQISLSSELPYCENPHGCKRRSGGLDDIERPVRDGTALLRRFPSLSRPSWLAGLSGASNFVEHGGWEYVVSGIEAGKWYRFTAWYHADGVNSENWQIVARLDWRNFANDRAFLASTWLNSFFDLPANPLMELCAV